MKEFLLFFWLENSDFDKNKEESIQGDFLTAFFASILGYKKYTGITYAT
ncbi:hypothetical protein [Peribacillus frigoritolerans]